MKKPLKSCVIGTPLGDMTAIADDSYLYLLGFVSTNKMHRKVDQIKKHTNADVVEGTNEVLQMLNDQLSGYFDGKLKTFSVPLCLIGTEFQKSIWDTMIQLEYGQTKSYGELALMSGRSVKYSRVVGAAAGANPIVVIVPCHRITAQNEQLGGFSCGIDKKIWLLKHENAYKFK